MPYGPGRWCYDCNFSHKPEICNCNPANIPDRLDLRPKGAASMYQIYLVIKEDMKTPVGEMLVSGHVGLDEAAEQCLINFQRLQDAMEISARVDELILALAHSGEENEIMAEAFIKIIEKYLT